MTCWWLWTLNTVHATGWLETAESGRVQASHQHKPSLLSRGAQRVAFLTPFEEQLGKPLGHFPRRCRPSSWGRKKAERFWGAGGQETVNLGDRDKAEDSCSKPRRRSVLADESTVGAQHSCWINVTSCCPSCYTHVILRPCSCPEARANLTPFAAEKMEAEGT